MKPALVPSLPPQSRLARPSHWPWYRPSIVLGLLLINNVMPSLPGDLPGHWLGGLQPSQAAPVRSGRPFKVVLPPVPRTIPGGAAGAGASRGCEEQPALVAQALGQPLPTDASQSTLPMTWARTSQAQPTIWADIPFPKGNVGHLRLLLFDAQGRPVAAPQPIVAPIQPGWIAVQTRASLALPQLYRWQLAGRRRCTDAQEFGPMTTLTQGWLDYQPVTTSLQTQLQQESAFNQAGLYASHGYWLDALTIVGKQLNDLRLSPSSQPSHPSPASPASQTSQASQASQASKLEWEAAWSMLLRSLGQPDRRSASVDFR